MAKRAKLPCLALNENMCLLFKTVFASARHDALTSLTLMTLNRKRPCYSPSLLAQQGSMHRRLNITRRPTFRDGHCTPAEAKVEPAAWLHTGCRRAKGSTTKEKQTPAPPRLRAPHRPESVGKLLQLHWKSKGVLPLCCEAAVTCKARPS